METQYRIIEGGYKSFPMSLHECLLHINVHMAGLVHWKESPITVRQAMGTGYRIVKA